MVHFSRACNFEVPLNKNGGSYSVNIDWLVKNQFNDSDCKKMNWLMTGGNHATVDTSGENFTMHCDSMCYKCQRDLPGIDRLKYIGCGRLINSCSIDTPARLLKLELGAQLPIKSLPKLKRDIVKSLKRGSFCGQLTSHGSKYWQGRSIMPHHRDESIEYALPNSRSSFFDNSVVQKFEAVSELHSHYHTTDYIRDTYEYEMMQFSGECMSFCVGGPRYIEAPTIVETFDQSSSWNRSKDFLPMNNSYKDCGYVAKSPLYRNHPKMVAFNNNFDWRNNKDDQLDPFKDVDNYGYMASQLSHLPKAMGYDPGNMLSHIPIPAYSTTSFIRNSITSRQIHSTFFKEVKEQQYVKRSQTVKVIQHDPLNDPSVYMVIRKSLLSNKMQVNYNDDQSPIMCAPLSVNCLKWSESLFWVTPCSMVAVTNILNH